MTLVGIDLTPPKSPMSDAGKMCEFCIAAKIIARIGQLFTGEPGPSD